MSGYLDTTRPLPYCPGCGHSHVLRALDDALRLTGLPRERFVLVTDIGCVGLADSWFPHLHTVHSLHGRSTALASGMQLAQRGIESSRDVPLKPIVLIGDGGATLGLLHVVHAAQLDLDVTVLVHNNFLYGMTGGQHSGFTPEGLRTTTTPGGSPLPSLDLAKVLDGAGCGYFARWRVPGETLAGRIAEAIGRPGFACVELLELCPTFAARIGGVTGSRLEELARERGEELGVVYDRPARAGGDHPVSGDADPLAEQIEPNPRWRRLDRPARVVVAGKAGERVQSAARLAAIAAMLAGLRVTVRSDNPVTQGHGFSLAELTFSPAPILFTGPLEPDIVIATASEGLAELTARGTLESSGPATRIVIDSGLEAPAGLAGFEHRDLRRSRGPRVAALAALISEISAAGWWKDESWKAAAELMPSSRRKEVLSLIPNGC